VAEPGGGEVGAPFEQLDFLYMPSRDVAADLAYFADVLGGQVVFAIEAMGTRVAGVRLAQQGPVVLLTEHLEGEMPILIHRVADLPATLRRLEAQGWRRARTFEIPHGPCCSFQAPGGQRLALYELTRPEAVARFDGRRDF
jgi:hypothetical protein